MKSIKKCPHCSERNIIKYGKFHDVQRYKCKNCKKTFSDVTNTEFYYYKKAKLYLKEYAKFMYDGFSLRECAYKMEENFEKITLKTAYLWRHKILNILQETNEGYKLKGLVESVTFKCKENHKGDRKIQKSTRENIYSIVSLDSMKRSRPTIYSVGRIRDPKVNKILDGIMEEDTLFFHSNAAFLNFFERRHNPKIEIEKPNDFLKDNVFMMIKNWLVRFRGVRTKNLEKYLGWFILDYKNHRKNIEKDEGA